LARERGSGRRYGAGDAPHLWRKSGSLEEWYPLFRDDLMASAAMDRLLHHAHVVVIDGNSFRNPPRARKAS
jgi:DNA replication protein DnaC